MMESISRDFNTDIINMFKDLKKILSVLRRKTEYIKRTNEMFCIWKYTVSNMKNLLDGLNGIFVTKEENSNELKDKQ